MINTDLFSLGFGCYIKKSDILGIYAANTTVKKLASKTIAPFENYIVNNLNKRKCQSYIETPFHLYLCAYPVDVMKEMFESGNEENFEAIRTEVEGEEWLKAYQEKKAETWQDVVNKARTEAFRNAQLQWAKKLVKNAEENNKEVQAREEASTDSE